MGSTYYIRSISLVVFLNRVHTLFSKGSGRTRVFPHTCWSPVPFSPPRSWLFSFRRNRSSSSRSPTAGPPRLVCEQWYNRGCSYRTPRIGSPTVTCNGTEAISSCSRRTPCSFEWNTCAKKCCFYRINN